MSTFGKDERQRGQRPTGSCQEVRELPFPAGSQTHKGKASLA